MNRRIGVLTMALFMFSDLFSQQVDSIPIELEKVVIDIDNGSPFIYVKNFKSGSKYVQNYFIRSLRNTNGIYPGLLKETIERQLTKLGFEIPGRSAFERLERKKKSEFSIAVSCKDFKVFYNSLGSKLEATNSAEWQVLDIETNAIVYSKTIKAKHYTEDRILVIPSSGSYFADFSVGIEESIFNSIDSLLADQDFISALTAAPIIIDEEYENAIIIPEVNYMASSSPIQNGINGSVSISSSGGIGSEFFISTDGLILTCKHVVEGLEEVNIELGNGVSILADVIRENSDSDLALLKVRDATCKPLKLEKNSTVEIGEDVMAIGTPLSLELERSVSSGIISGQRTIDGVDYLQTDASVSPGNSGGPLIDASGQVVGIITAKAISYGAEGIGFAIPIEVALEVLNIEIN